MTVKIVTGSVADLVSQVVKELGITVIPLNVRFGTDVCRAGVDIMVEQFYDKLRHGKILQVTSALSPGAFAEAYDKLAERLSFRFPKERIYRSGTSPVIGTHTGPGLLLVAVLGDKKTVKLRRMEAEPC